MALIRQSDYELRSKQMLELVSKEMVEITPERVSVIARRLVNQLRRNYRRMVSPAPAAAILGRIEDRSPEEILAGAERAQTLLREAVLGIVGPEAGFALSSRPKLVLYVDDDDTFRTCRVIFSELIDVPAEDFALLANT